MRETGLVHLYYGEGKGKTTCAMGLALRCAGHGSGVVIAQFLKDGTSGECRALARMEQVTLLAAHPAGKFSRQMNEAERAQTADAIARTFAAATGYAVRSGAAMLVLDEVCAAIACGFLEEQAVLEFLESRPEGLEVVLTGREPTRALLDAADYCTEMRKIRHPFDRGVTAREGIER